LDDPTGARNAVAQIRAIRQEAAIRAATPDTELADARVEVARLQQAINATSFDTPREEVRQLQDQLRVARAVEESIEDVIKRRRAARAEEAAEARRQIEELRVAQARAAQEAEVQRAEAARQTALQNIFEEAVRNAERFRISELFDLDSIDEVEQVIRDQFSDINRVVQFGAELGIDAEALRVAEQVNTIREAGATRVAQIEQESARQAREERIEGVREQRRLLQEQADRTARSLEQTIATLATTDVSPLRDLDIGTGAALRERFGLGVEGIDEFREAASDLSTAIARLPVLFQEFQRGDLTGQELTDAITPLVDQIGVITGADTSLQLALGGGDLTNQQITNFLDNLRALSGGLSNLVSASSRGTIAQVESSREVLRELDRTLAGLDPFSSVIDGAVDPAKDFREETIDLVEATSNLVDTFDQAEQQLAVDLQSLRERRAADQLVPQFEADGGAVNTGAEIGARIAEGGRVTSDEIGAALREGSEILAESGSEFGRRAGTEFVNAQVAQTEAIRAEREAIVQAQREAAAEAAERERLLQTAQGRRQLVEQVAIGDSVTPSGIIDRPTAQQLLAEISGLTAAASQAQADSLAEGVNRFAVQQSQASAEAAESTRNLTEGQQIYENALQRLAQNTITAAESIDALADEAFNARVAAARNGVGNITGFNEGGIVRGQPGVDKIFARLTNGEFVVNAQQTAKFLPILRAINNGTFQPRGFQNGGLVTPGPISVTVNESQNPQVTARAVVAEINRGIRTGTIKLRNR
jgi:hypothetical protein